MWNSELMSAERWDHPAISRFLTPLLLSKLYSGSQRGAIFSISCAVVEQITTTTSSERGGEVREGKKKKEEEEEDKRGRKSSWNGMDGPDAGRIRCRNAIHPPSLPNPQSIRNQPAINPQPGPEPPSGRQRAPIGYQAATQSGNKKKRKKEKKDRKTEKQKDRKRADNQDDIKALDQIKAGIYGGACGAIKHGRPAASPLPLDAGSHRKRKREIKKKKKKKKRKEMVFIY